jgi:uncharacterized membrane protein (DUF2068 family)
VTGAGRPDEPSTGTATPTAGAAPSATPSSTPTDKEAASPIGSPGRELGLRVIIFYKLARTTLAYACSAVLWGLILAGDADRVRDLAPHVRHHLTAAWSLQLVDALVSAADKHHLEVLAAALALDGSFTLFEWYALRTGRPWGAWLVVLATASLLPFEAVAIVRHHSPGRVVILVVNLAIVAYLARRSLRRHGVPWGRGSSRGS